MKTNVQLCCSLSSERCPQVLVCLHIDPSVGPNEVTVVLMKMCTLQNIDHLPPRLQTELVVIQAQRKSTRSGPPGSEDVEKSVI